MKKIFTIVISLLTITMICHSQANQTLSNLTSPTAVNITLLPNSTNTKNLGSSGLSWKNLYLRGDIYLDGIKYMHNTGAGNTFIGAGNGNAITTGFQNVAVGDRALDSNTSGTGNTASGFEALFTNKAGNYNTAVGNSALHANKTGSYNTASGLQALYTNTTGNHNMASGYQALYTNTTGDYNTAYGNLALYKSNSLYNTAVGYQALYNSTGSYNTAVGYQAAFNSTSFTTVTAIGYQALLNNIDGIDNTAIGTWAGKNNISGLDNTAVGVLAGLNNSDFSTFLGYRAYSVADASNSVAIGYESYASASNQVRIGNDQVTSIGGFANWTNISDGRVKKNIKTNVPGLAFINKLKPVTYNLNLDAADKIMQKQVVETPDGKTKQASPEELTARKQKEQIIYTGFIAQDVEKAAKELNYNFSGVDAAKNDKDLYGIRYAEFVVPLVKAVQELSQQNDELKKQNEIQQKQIDELKAIVVSGNQTSLITGNTKAVMLNSTFLEQNIPNPFKENTIITFSIPGSAKMASIVITESGSGKIVKTIPLSTTASQLTIAAGTLTNGIYTYTLLADGKKIDTKQMVIAR